MQRKKITTKTKLIYSLAFIVSIIAILYFNDFLKFPLLFSVKNPKNDNLTTTITTPTLPPTPTPTPKPLTFAQMNELYGPCIHLPTLMYHHIQDQEQAAASGSTNLTVFTDTFRTQMEYLSTQGYSPVSPSQITSFFDQGSALPVKPILITFDDGYQDFYTNAWPILKEFSFKATVFLPTGLMDNPGYLNWSQISEMSSNVDFANHTWSHHNAAGNYETIEKEITLADNQLAEHGQNNSKVFSYPYGFSSNTAQQILSSLNYQLAFTTTSGSTLCNQQKLTLPRIRIGNIHLSYYGF